MASSDYYLCDVCNQKAFYDANLNYDFDNVNPFTGALKLDYVGEMKVICIECSKIHKITIETK